MPADNELDPLDRWLNQQVQPLPPPPGTFELIARRARRRKIRKAVVSALSAAAVVAAIGVAVPLSTTLRLTTTPATGTLAGGTSTSANESGSRSAPGSASPQPARPATASSAASATAGQGQASGGYLPPNFQPTSVTWDSASTGWVLGPAGTPGHCANKNPDICTSVARTEDGGQTWHGLPAPDAAGAESWSGVTGLRFLNATYGWAFGPGLWETDDGGEHWHQVNTNAMAVTDLETVNGRAYALFGFCSGGAGVDIIDTCTAYQLKTSKAGSDAWTPVGGIPAKLAGGTAGQASAVIELTSTTGYLVAPDGTLYEGPMNGGAWHKVATLPCTPGAAQVDGAAQGLMLAPGGSTAAGTRLALACVQTQAPGPAVSVYVSNDNGSTWAKQANATTSGIGIPESLTTLPDGTLILATIAEGAGSADGGIYLFPPGATHWQAATITQPGQRSYGFSYVGMTNATQGVALGGNPDLHGIWMTVNGGRTWLLRPIKS